MDSADAAVQANCSFTALQQGCGDPRSEGWLQGRYMLEDFKPFASPPELMAPCTCFHANGTYRLHLMDSVNPNPAALLETHYCHSNRI